MNSKSTAGTSLPPQTQSVPLEPLGPLPLDATDVENPPHIDHAPPTSSSVLAPFPVLVSPTDFDEEPAVVPAFRSFLATYFQAFRESYAAVTAHFWATDVENPPIIDHAPPTSSYVLAPFPILVSPTDLDEEPAVAPALPVAPAFRRDPATYFQAFRESYAAVTAHFWATDVENPPIIDHAPPTSSSVLAPFPVLVSPTDLDEEPAFVPATYFGAFREHCAAVVAPLWATFTAGTAIHGDGAGMDAEQEGYSKRVDEILKLVVPLSVVSGFALFVNVPPSVLSNLVLQSFDSALLFLGVVMPLSLIRFLIRPRVSSTPEMKKMAMLISFVPLALDFLLRIVVGF